MKSKQGCVIFAAILLLLCGLIGLALLGVQFLSQRQEQARRYYLPPVVQITEPQSGARAPVGSYLSADATITFSPQNPVQTVEWWLNGVLVESHPLQPGAGVKYDSFSLLIPTEGMHMLVARVINTLGVIGQSQPLTFQGVAKGEAFYAVTMNKGETLESVAAEYGSDAGTLQTLNPGLGNSVTLGATIKVPIPAENEPPSPLPTPPAINGGVTLVSTSPILKVADIPSEIFSLLVVTPPKAPTNLQGEVKDCKVKLLWEDNATNESGYEVWMAAPGASLTRLTTLQPASGGVAWFEFQAPGPGYLLFWVEAVNALGQQDSNIIYLNMDAGCPSAPPTHLQIEILDIAISGSVERFYCYISFENATEARLPAQDGNFIAVQGGRGNIAAWPHTFGVSIPADGALNLSGECWGWAGQDLSKLGTFTTSLGSETWDGAPRLLHGGAFDMSLSVLPQGMGGTRMTYINDANMPEPRNFRLEYEVDNYNCKLGCWVLRWDFDYPMGWNGYYDIYWDVTEPFVMDRELGHKEGAYSHARYISYSGREALVQMFGCEKDIRFVITYYDKDSGQSSNAILYYRLPQCQAWVAVTFDKLELPWTGDGAFSGPCDGLEVYYTLSVNEQKRNFWGGCSFGVGCLVLPLQCGTHSFKDLAEPIDPNPDTITVDIYTDDVILKIQTWFYDYDWPDGDDIFAPHTQYHYWPTRAHALAELGCGKSFSTDMYVNGTADSILHYTIKLLPNPCDPYYRP